MRQRTSLETEAAAAAAQAERREALARHATALCALQQVPKRYSGCSELQLQCGANPGARRQSSATEAACPVRAKCVFFSLTSQMSECHL